MIGIIGALQAEVSGLVARMDRCRTERVGGMSFCYGFVGKQDVVAVKCGIGLVSAAVATTLMIERYNPTLIINLGVAGSLASNVHVMDIVVAAEVVQHDMDTTAVGDPLGTLSDIDTIFMTSDYAYRSEMIKFIKSPFHEGTIASGDKFISKLVDKQHIVNNFGAIACEMEGASVSHVCTLFRVPFVILRTISDDGDVVDYENFMESAAAQSIEVVTAYLNSCGGTPVDPKIKIKKKLKTK